tara:strand:+ start:801 stop:1037 length:237 start_codon:yes stop_codon:yes gene_type:complete
MQVSHSFVRRWAPTERRSYAGLRAKGAVAFIERKLDITLVVSALSVAWRQDLNSSSAPVGDRADIEVLAQIFARVQNG